ncbi:hypothetical protein PMI01_03057 [Caulobacter sp. AP07]|uniref:hypothetical protein n=1 Tax=Caulobacter sp. AP07 TaxID=1144304 RepID=UPI000271F2AF|nr:hypothetical protein [Caulobacter sp. AP07]EJL30665.1 hypothetical protein PMI01_03057 [Caulobacter sp. AP07]
MPETITLNLTVYQPAIMAGPDEQVGFEYDLTIVVPDLKAATQGDPAVASTARCEVVPVTGTLSFPNPAVPVISPFTGLMFIYDNAPLIGFPLTIIAQGAEEFLTFNMNLCFPASPLYAYSGAIMFGEWPGPLSNVTASFLCPQPT